MNSVEEEEAILHSPVEKQKVDNEEVYGEISDEEIRSALALLSEPEWEVDSYDGREYLSDPEEREGFETDDNYRAYCRRRRDAIANRGFEGDRFNGLVPMTNIKPVEFLIALCINKYNKEKGKTLEYISPVKGNVCAGPKFKFYITIMAREFPNGPAVEYQVKIVTYAGNWRPPVPILCRPTPKPSTSAKGFFTHMNPTTDSVVEDESIIPSPIKKQKLDDGGNSDEYPEPELDLLSEPEWGYDSYEGREFKPEPEHRELFDNDAEYEQFLRWRTETVAQKGFVADKFRGIWPIPNVKSAEDLIALCIDKYNKVERKTLEYVSTVQGNLRTGAKFTYYMTIMAKESPSGPLVEYQVKVVAFAGAPKPPVPVFCRPSPPNRKLRVMRKGGS